MSDSGRLTILIGSVGRRVYLVDWFVRAFDRLGIDGEVHVTDTDPRAAAYAAAPYKHRVPPYVEPGYADAMSALIDEIRPDLFFSLNDYEIEILAMSGLAASLEAKGTAVLVPRAEIHARVHDKLEMYSALSEVGVPTAKTVLFADRRAVSELAAESPELIIKDRYGSGSSGLIRLPSAELGVALSWLARPSNSADLSSLVVQPALSGVEYGLDVIAPLHPEAHEVFVLARRKVRMRAGETDQAETVDGTPFLRVGRDLARWTRHRGGIDVDVIRTDDGAATVIDINPRFGGGYPFSHVAGADLPALLISQLSGGGDASEFLRYRTGVSASKHEAIIGVD